MIFSQRRIAAALATFVAALIISGGALAQSDEPRFTRPDYPSENVVDERFDFDAGESLEIDVDDVDVYIKESTGGAHVQVFVAGPDLERAREYFAEEMFFSLEKKGAVLVMECYEPDSHSRRFWMRFRNVRVWAVIAVPAKANADIATDDGDLRIDRLDGKLRIRTRDGDVDARDLKGSIEIESSDGDITLGSFEADEIFVETSDGDLHGKRLSAGRISLVSSDGDIEVERVEGDRISVESSDGDIEIGVSGKELDATSSDGDIDIRMFSDMAVDLVARDGNIRINIPETIKADLNLRGEDVSMRGGIKIRGSVSDRSIVGSLNDGGPLVRAKTQDGSIDLYIERAAQ